MNAKETRIKLMRENLARTSHFINPSRPGWMGLAGCAEPTSTPPCLVPASQLQQCSQQLPACSLPPAQRQHSLRQWHGGEHQAWQAAGTSQVAVLSPPPPCKTCQQDQQEGQVLKQGLCVCHSESSAASNKQVIQPAHHLSGANSLLAKH